MLALGRLIEHSKSTAESRLLLNKPHYHVLEVAFGGGGFRNAK